MSAQYISDNFEATFDRHDVDRSGKLTVNEVSLAVVEMYQTFGKQPS